MISILFCQNASIILQLNIRRITNDNIKAIITIVKYFGKYYSPIEKTDVLKVDEEKAIKWLMNGAQPTDTVKSLFKELGINQKFLEAKKAAKATK